MDRGAFAGVKVVEYSTMVSGPYCGKMLADLGADVIKIEEPPCGDPARTRGPFPGDRAHPERSGLFLYLNTSKRGAFLDLRQPNDLETFRRLLGWADVLIDNHPPARLESLGLGWDELRRLNSRLVVTSITPYGRTGPRASFKGSELTAYHGGGMGSVLPTRSEDISRAPIKAGGYPTGYHAGLTAALATASALIEQRESGEGCLIDLSEEEAILAMVRAGVASTVYHRSSWSRVPDRPPALGRLKCKDGYIVILLIEDHHWRGFVELMGNPEWAAGDEWNSLAYRTEHLMEIGDKIEAWAAQHEKEELHHEGAAKGFAIGSMYSAAEVMNYRQYLARDYFVDVEHPETGELRHAGWPYKMPASPPWIRRPAPLLGQQNEEVRRIAPQEQPRPAAADRDGGGAGRRRLPLEGVRVLDLTWVYAGPYATMLLALLGAEVIKVESEGRMDIMRRALMWPLFMPKPLEIPANDGMAFSSLNLGKLGATIAFERPGGIDLLKRLVAVSDVVMENMRAGIMDRIGLGYDELKKVNPRLIMLSSSARGATGPESQYAGYATVHHAVGGNSLITGYPDGPPCTTMGDVDLMNATTAAFAVVAALHHRNKTGEGQFIDYSQCEGVSSLIGEVLLEYEMNGRSPTRQGNRDPFIAPHGVYRCWGVDRWVAIAAETDDEFRALANAIGRPELAEDHRFLDAPSRKRNEEELDAIIEAWTRKRDRDLVARTLGQAGVAASPSRTGEELFHDPHLRAREAFVKVEHPNVGEREFVGLPWKMSGHEIEARHAPLLGEHNDYVFRQVLGMDEEEYSRLVEEGVIR